METLSVVLSSYIFISNAFLADAKILQAPVNSETQVGEEVALRCRTNAAPPEWMHTRVKSSSFDLVYKRGLILGDYYGRMYVSDNNTDGDYDLVIRNVTLDDAGSYKCIDLKGDDGKAELTVFESIPSNDTCFTSIPRDSADGYATCKSDALMINITCRIRYSGNTEPFPEWVQSSTGEMIDSHDISFTNGSLSSTIVVLANHETTNIYSCRIKYRKSNQNSSYAWSSLPIRAYSLNNSAQILARDCSHKEVDCQDLVNLDATETCNYTWSSDAGVIANESKLLLASLKSGTYVCRVDCLLHGYEMCTSKIVEVNYSVCNAFPTARLLVGVLLGLTIPILVTIFVKTKRLRKTRLQVSGPLPSDENSNNPSRVPSYATFYNTNNEKDNEAKELLSDSVEKSPEKLDKENLVVLETTSVKG